MKAHPEMQVVGAHMAQEFYERFSANARFRLQSERTGLIRNASSPSLAKQGILAMIPPLNRLVVCPLLVGRQAHLQTLRLLMDHVQAGRGQSAILVGEAGIGKSRLAAEVAALAAKQDFAVLLGNCFEPDRMMPYAPLVDLLRGFSGAHSLDELARTAGLCDPASLPQASALLNLLPELTAFVRSPLPVLAPPQEAEQDRHRLWLALNQFFLELASSRPVVIILEDLHWCDDSSLDFLLFLARQLRNRPIFLVLTCRSDEATTGTDSLLAGLERERLAVELSLPRLSRLEVDMMIRACFALDGPFWPELLESVYSLTEGNPFFVEETLKSLLAQGHLQLAEGRLYRRSLGELRIPRTIRVATRRRTEALSQPARRLLTLAAVAGRRFDFPLLQALAEHDEAELLWLIRELIEAQLFVEESTELFAFRHALTREAVYADLLGRERKALHRKVAEVLEQLSTQSHSRSARLGDLAYQFYEAGDWAKALQYGQQAGDMAQALYAPRAAITHFTRAQEAARQLALAPAPALYRARGKAYETLGHFDQTRADYKAVLQMVRDRGDQPGEWQSLLDLAGLWKSRDHDCARDYIEKAVRLARAMADAAPLAQTLNHLGNWHVNAGQPSEGQRYHQEALAIFQALDDRRSLAKTLDLLGMACYLSDETARGTAYFEQAVALFRALDDRAGLSTSLATMAWNGFNALKNGEEAARIAHEIGWRSGEAYALIGLASDAVAKGNYSHALPALQDGLRIAEEIEHRQWMTAAHCVSGRLYVDLRLLDRAHQHLETGLALANEIGSTFWGSIAAELLATVYVLRREFDCASGILGPLNDGASVAQWWAGSAQGQLALAQDKPGFALQIAEAALAGSASGDRANPRLLKLRGEALLALARTSEAEIALRSALKVAQAHEAYPLVWRIQVSLGRLWLKAGKPAQAARTFSGAQALASELTYSIPDSAVRQKAQQQVVACLPRQPARKAGRGARGHPDGLSEREREVAVLIGQGKSNREIAAALFVSERTVTTHISHIFGKLSFNSRTQIAAWAVKQGLVVPSSTG